MNKPKSSKLIIFAGLVVICIILIYLFISNKNGNQASNNLDEVDDKMDNNVESSVDEAEVVEEFSRNETIIFPSVDDLEITADLYLIDKTSPIILLFHRAGWSRGEYLEIAPKLNELGYNAMAIDARSGLAINDVKNETAEKSYDQQKGNGYPDAAKDVEAAIKYANEELGYDNIITWGSSYSADLVVALSQNYSDTVIAVLAFAPGDYMVLQEQSITEHAKELTLPVFVTGSRPERFFYEEIYKAIPSEDKVLFIPKANGFHGSEALWSQSEGNEEYWEAVASFLDSLNVE